MTKQEIIEYADGELKLNVYILPGEQTVWLNRSQIANLFDRDIKTIGKHINNTLKEELDSSTVAKFETVQKEGNRQVSREIEFYNLDMIISVGYRVKSKRGIAFRKWATEILKQYMIQGYAVNEKRLEVLNRTIEFQNEIISNISSIAGIEGNDILEIVHSYSNALNLLDDYDHQKNLNPTEENLRIIYLQMNVLMLLKKQNFMVNHRYLEKKENLVHLMEYLIKSNKIYSVKNYIQQ